MRAISKIIIIALVVVVVAAGAAAALLLAQPQGKAKVFYVVAYHWGFAYYDENLNEIPRISVKKGDRVKIYVFPSTAFDESFRTQLERRTLEKGIGEFKAGDTKILDEIKAAKDNGLLDHGFMIQGYGQQIFTDHRKFTSRATSVKELIEREDESVLEAHAIEFTADKAGTYFVICTVVCGYGHAWMLDEDGFVVEG